jgi:hypothetical protein
VNKNVKSIIIGKKRSVTKAQMLLNVEDFMHGRKNDRKQVQKYFQISLVR